MKRLALFLDGTWNDPDNNTNVWRLKLMVARPESAGVRQLVYYRKGVGTAWHNRLTGGALGRGLSQTVCDAYQWLMEHYDLGDEIYLFGYSRGAFTARSVAGLIAKCGLLMPEAPIAIPQLFSYYRQRQVPLYQLEYLDRHPQSRARAFEPLEESLLRYSKRVQIKFIGVFDTVGALGIPLGQLRGLSSSSFAFHHTRLSKIFEHAYQALAIDEHRIAYRAGLWRRFVADADGRSDEDLLPEASESTQHVEQRWFLGTHGNVGGGYPLDPLTQIPLHWMQQQAAAVGLQFRREVRLRGDEHRAEFADAYGNFLGGAYRLAKLGRRHYRTIRAAPETRTSHDGQRGTIQTVNETIDETVMQRWKEDPSYRPKNLQAYFDRADSPD